MRRNVEIKAILRDRDQFIGRIVDLADNPPEYLQQTDTFYNVKHCRLKLRSIGDRNAELIYYRRANLLAPKTSTYLIIPVLFDRLIHRVLALFFGVRGEISKTRIVYKIGSTRVHLDAVDSLGDFVEIEVILGPSQTQEEGIIVAKALMKKLHISDSQLVSNSYIDMLESACLYQATQRA